MSMLSILRRLTEQCLRHSAELLAMAGPTVCFDGEGSKSASAPVRSIDSRQSEREICNLAAPQFPENLGAIIIIEFCSKINYNVL